MPERDNLRGLLILGAGADAADTVIDGDGNGPVVVNPGGGPALVLRRLTITGGNAEQGGGIFTRARALALNDVRVTGNRATLGGGGIFSAGNDESSVQLGFTDITNNEARSGGGIFHAGGGSLSIGNESTIIGNRATQNGSGGGIHNAGGDVRLDDAVVRDNTPQNCFGVEGC
jgi:predicted outer membrane repeat protein